MLLLLVDSQIRFGRQCKIKQHRVLWVDAYTYNIQNLGVISFLSYVYFKWFSEWMPFLSELLLLALTYLSFYSLMLTLPPPPDLIFSLFSWIISLFLYGWYLRIMFCSILDFVPTCCTSLFTHSLSLHSNICEHVASLWRVFQEQPSWFMLPLSLCPDILIFLWCECQVDTRDMVTLISPKQSFLLLLISLRLVSLV